MSIIKNSVGRPSNETLKKRKIVKIIALVIGIIVMVVLGYNIGRYFKSKDINSIEKNAVAQTNIKVKINSKTKNATIYKCPLGRIVTKKVKGNLKYSCTKGSIRTMNVPYYSSTDSKWGNITSACGGGKINEKGCIPTSAAIALSAISGKNILPSTVNSYVKKYAKTIGCSGTSYNIKAIEKAGNYYIGKNFYMIDSLKTWNNKLSSIYSRLTENCVGMALIDYNRCRKVGSLKNAGLCYSGTQAVAFYASNFTEYVYVNHPKSVAKSGIRVKASDLLKATSNNRFYFMCNTPD